MFKFLYMGKQLSSFDGEIHRVAIFYKPNNSRHWQALYTVNSEELGLASIKAKRRDEEHHSDDQRMAYRVLIERARKDAGNDAKLMAWCDEQWKIHKLDDVKPKEV